MRRRRLHLARHHRRRRHHQPDHLTHAASPPPSPARPTAPAAPRHRPRPLRLGAQLGRHRASASPPTARSSPSTCATTATARAAAVHDYPAMAADLAETIAAHGGRADLLGHSMGGKAAMALALTEPGRVRRLIVADMAPVAYGHSQLALRRGDAGRRPRGASPAAPRPTPRSRRASPSRACAPSSLQSLALRGRTAPRWKLNLAALGAEMPEIMGFPDLAGQLRRPDALPDRRRLRLRPPRALAAHPRALSRGASTQAIAGAGHWLHADAPAAFIAAVRPSSTDPGFTCRPAPPAGGSAAPAARVRHRPARGARHHLRGLHRLPLRGLAHDGRSTTGPLPGFHTGMKPYRADQGPRPRAGRTIDASGRLRPLSAGGRPQRRPTAKRRPSGSPLRARPARARRAPGLSSAGSRAAEASGRRPGGACRAGENRLEPAGPRTVATRRPPCRPRRRSCSPIPAASTPRSS